MPSCPSDRAERAASAEKRCTIAKCRWSASPWALASMSSAFATIVILAAGFTGIAFALFQFRRIARIRLNDTAFSETANLNDGDGSEDKMAKLIEIYEAIRQGADSFLFAEYKICAVFLVAFGFLVLILCSRTSENGEVAWQWTSGVLTSISFWAGGVTSIVSGYIGMKVRRQRSRVLAVLAAAALYRSRTAQVAVFSNARTTVSAMMPDPWKESFNTAFRAGSVMGFSLCGIGLLSLYLICNVYTLSFDWTRSESCKLMFECVSGFGLGGSAIALFGRVGGGIYTKAADVGADLAGKVVENIPEDDPRNPAVIADNVGDNVGDVRLHHAIVARINALLRQAFQGRGPVLVGCRHGLGPVRLVRGGLVCCAGYRSDVAGLGQRWLGSVDVPTDHLVLRYLRLPRLLVPRYRYPPGARGEGCREGAQCVGRHGRRPLLRTASASVAARILCGRWILAAWHAEHRTGTD